MLDDHLGFVDDELVSPPDMLDREGARLVLRPSAEGGGGLDKKGKSDSLFFLGSLLTSIASAGSGDDTAILFPGGLNGLRGGGLGGNALLATPDDAGVAPDAGCGCFGAEIETEEPFRLSALFSLPPLEDLTLAVTLEANRFKGDIVRDTADGVETPLLSPRLLVPLVLLVSLDVFRLNMEGVER